MVGERYCIKAEYRVNQQAVTYEGDKSGIYWTAERIEMAAVFQYYVYKKCQDLLRSRGYKSLLDIGSGPPMKVKQLLAPYCNDIVLVDQLSLAQLARQILPQGEFVSANLESAYLELSRRFELVVCADVLEHLINPDNCLNLIERHLAPGGLAVLSTPERDYLRGKDCYRSSKPEHVREWNCTEFSQYITSRGFKIVEQFFVPQLKIGQVEFLCSRILSPFIRNRRWSSCQVIICK